MNEFADTPVVNNLAVSCGVGAGGPVHFVSSQKLVLERKPDVFPNVQIHNSLSCSDIANDCTKKSNETAESTDVNYIVQGKEKLTNTDELNKKAYQSSENTTTTTNGGLLKHSLSDLCQSDTSKTKSPPVLPLKSTRRSSVINNDSNHSVDSKNALNQDSNTTGGGGVTATTVETSHIPSPDLLREVMDAFDKRRSGVDFRGSDSIDW
ncbi:unnamed protein product [Trichobilharzia regenti]|nr:unnamed protein product [Trichobilharzia regenti]